MVSRKVVDEFAKIPTSNVSDALDRFRIKGGLEDISPIVDNVRIAGTAFTVRFVPANQVELKPWVTYIDKAQPGDVVVIDNGGRKYCTVWGGLLSARAKDMGLRGTVIDGVCRDIDVIRAIRYPVFSRGRFMMTGKDRVQLAGLNEPINIANVLIKPGDVIVADDSGVVVVPQEKAEEVLEAALEIYEKESKILEEVKRGVPLSEARAKYGYGELQRPKGLTQSK
ncbi:MAG: RraA family protein [Thaumarchaeota archaeon]|nr:RraA family protein [Candidatus Calditenuaceae archaeon]MDW8186700.1 RraA family protein [Nitrososphaerota archaeon]